MMNFDENPRLNVFKSGLVKGAQFSADNEFPLLKRTDFVPTEAIPFNIATRTKNYNQWLHFYIRDYLFERVWKDPDRYLPLFKRFRGVITPDYSLYREMPLVMQRWNTYRNRAIAYWLQSKGVNTVSGTKGSRSRATIHQGKQDKHIPGTKNYKQQTENGKKPSILNEDPGKLLAKERVMVQIKRWLIMEELSGSITTKKAGGITTHLEQLFTMTAKGMPVLFQRLLLG